MAATVGLQPKRRAVLKDVTNVSANGMQIDCLNVTEIQVRTSSDFILKFSLSTKMRR